MKRIAALLVLISFLAACGSTSTPNQPPVYTVTEIQGTLPNWTQGPAEITSAAGASASTDGSLELHGPIYTGTVNTNGSFTINLTTPPASELESMTCGNQQANGAGTGHFIISPDAPPSHESEILAHAALIIPGEPQRDILWFYADRPFRFSGECEGSTLDVNLAQGWNTVIFTSSSSQMISAPIPADAVWTVWPRAEP